MSTRRRIQQGFTLVEILIVVVILGILAAIVIPQFTSASESARGSSLVTQLQSIRSQLELAQIQHGGVYPNLISATGANWVMLTAETETDGAYTAGDASGDEVGPYLQKAPVNPFTNSTAVAASGSAAANIGWTYTQATGAIRASVLNTKATELGLTALDVDTYTP